MEQKSKMIHSKFKAFSSHSTLHGMYYFYKSSKWTVHLFWSFIIIFSLTVFAFLSQMIYQKFIIDPTFTVVESTRYSISDVPFPAVTVCDNGLVYGPNTENITAILIRRGYTKEQIKIFYRSLQDVKDLNYVPEPYLMKMHSLLDDLGYPYPTLMDMVKKPCDILLMDCVWRSKAFNCSDMFRTVSTYRGHCCQFDIPYFRAHVKQDTFTSGVAITEGLWLRVNGDEVDLDGNIKAGNAFLYIFDQKDGMTILNSYTILTWMTYYDVNMDVWAIDSSENVKGLSLQNRKCLLNSDAGADFYQGCLFTAMLRKVVDSCRCLPFNYTAADLQVTNYAQCSWDRLFCVYGTLDKVVAEVRSIIVNSGCFQRCDYVQYETKVKYIREVNRVGLHGNSSRVMIHFADNTYMMYRREVLYTWDQMLANLGGIFGLCVGGSLISIIELLWFLADIVYTMIMPPETPARKKSLQRASVGKVSPLKFNERNGDRRIAFVN